MNKMALVIKYSKDNIVRMVGTKPSFINANHVYQIRNEVVPRTPIFVLTGGDAGKIKNRPEPGVWGIGVVSDGPVDDTDPGQKYNYYKFNIRIEKWFDKSVTQSDLMYYPQTFDTSSIGPSSKDEKKSVSVVISWLLLC